MKIFRGIEGLGVKNQLSFAGGKAKLELLAIGDDPITLASRNNVSEFEIFSLEIWKKLSANEFFAGVIWDIGSFIGIYSLVAAKASSENRIYGFEPSSNAFHRFLAHIHLNKKWNQVFPLKLALSNKSCRAILSNCDGWYSISGSSYVSNSDKPTAYFEEIVLETGDHLVFQNSFATHDYTQGVPQIAPPRLVKIDTGKHNVEVLQGMRGCIAETNPVILIEILTYSDLNAVQRELPEYFWLAIHEKDREFSSSTNFAIAGSNNFLFCHKSLIDEVSCALRIRQDIIWNLA
jgi:FkbM family methyltransferase